jgi:hypothetical protein
VNIEVEPYPIGSEKLDDTPQVRLARWVAWQIWTDGQIPRIAVSDISNHINARLKEGARKNQVPQELRGDVKLSGISRDTVNRLLGRKKRK